MPPPQTVSLYGLFELELSGPADGNPFKDVTLSARFSSGERTLESSGFYDGDGIFRIRFMPEELGQWTYETASNVSALNGLTGSFDVGPALPGAHGPVRVANRFHFKHADGTRFINIGTTAYVWNLQGEVMERQTLETLKTAPFTKIRMCVFPKHYRYNQNEPELYPFPLLKRGDSRWHGMFGEAGWSFDFERFEAAYFRHLEKRILDLAAIGIEADLIIFHPYDRWGFARMSPEQDDRYLRYLLARLSAFANVWWSMANEYDFMFNKPLDDWNRWLGIVAAADSHGHLVSIHNGFRPFDYNHPDITHVSIQRPYTEQAALWREQFGKPVSIDECCYEGDIGDAWGNISGRELVHRFWKGIVNGGYVTHGETYNNDSETLWWSKGGLLIGESVPRIAYLRRLLEGGPEDGLDPVKSTGPYRIMMAGGLDNASLPELFAPAPGEEEWSRVGSNFATAGEAHQFYLTYFGESQPGEVVVSVPPGERYDATLIDTWEMTETAIASGVERGHVLHFAARPYQALLLRRSQPQ